MVGDRVPNGWDGMTRWAFGLAVWVATVLIRPTFRVVGCVGFTFSDACGYAALRRRVRLQSIEQVALVVSSELDRNDRSEVKGCPSKGLSAIDGGSFLL